MTVIADPASLQTVRGLEDLDPSYASRLEIAAAVARISLDRRRGVVRSVLLTARSEETRTALRGLASWYERMCVDPDYCNDAPEDGINLLMAIGEDGNGKIERRLRIAYWSIRLAQELASCRAKLTSGCSAPEELDLALAKLDLALQGGA